MSGLYKILGIKKTASAAEITKAYRLQALQYHPDRNPEGVDQFKKISEAYTILSNETQRESYDRTGVLPSGGTNESDQVALSADLAKKVSDFFQIYRGSAEEVQDITTAFASTKGNLDKMIHDHVFFDNGLEDELIRIVNIMRKLVEDGVVAQTAAWKKTSTAANVQKISRALEVERAEAQKEIKKMHGDVNFRAAAAGDGDMSSLQQLILRQHANHDAFLNDLEAKYSAKPKKKTRRE